MVNLSTNDSPNVSLPLNEDMHAWLRDYAKQQGQSMSAILKDCLEELRHRDDAQSKTGNSFSMATSMKSLSKDQVDQYDRDGYLLVSGLIPEEIAAKAEAAMWRWVGINPDEPPASWEDVPGGIRLYNDADLVNCYTPQCLAAAAQLTRDDPSTFSKTRTHPKTYSAPDFRAAQEAGEDLTRFFRWDCTYAINVFPGSGEWTWPTPHIDHSLPEHNQKTFPPVFRLGALIYLNDVERHGGGTLVWPGSHHKMEALARQKPERYEYRSPLNEDLHEIDCGNPIELTLKRGDVLFLHHLCAHSGSLNLSNRPRFALNMKW